MINKMNKNIIFDLCSKTIWIFVYLSVLFTSCGGSNIPITNNNDTDDGKKNVIEDYTLNSENIARIEGNSIQIDPVVLYSQNISPEELVSDLKKANITSVHLVIVKKWDGSKDDSLFKPEYMKALQDNRIAIWLMLPGNCMYDQLPKEWEMEFIKPYADPSLRFYSFHHDGYVKWQEERVSRIFRNYDFVGIGFAESYFPEWYTIDTNGHYGDVSLFARKKFTREYLGLDRNALSFDAIHNNQEWYYKWQDFRVEAILNFNQKMKNAVREASPEAVFAAWGIAVGGGSLAEIREYYGLDMPKIAEEVQPDVFFIQTSYQDWGDPSLPPNYLNGYEYARKAIQEVNPKVKLAVQADIASLSYQNPGVGVRLPGWWLEFMSHATQLGYYTNTSYEYAFCKKQGLWLE